MTITRSIETHSLTSRTEEILRLIIYILSLRPGLRKAACFAQLSNLFLSTNPRDMIYEMIVAANLAPGNAKPIEHLVLSWPDSETINIADFKNIFQDFLKFYGLQNHQVVAALHNDTDHIHIHIVYNRFNIFTSRMKSINNGFTRRMNAMFNCFIEEKYGFSPSDHALFYKIDGEFYMSDFYNTSTAGIGLRDKRKRPGSQSVADQLASMIRSAIATSSTWDEFTCELRACGANVEEAKSGFVFAAPDSKGRLVHVAASRVCNEAERRHLASLFKAEVDPAGHGQPIPTDAVAIQPDPFNSSNMFESAYPYSRYSSRMSADGASISGYTAFLREICAVFPKGGHVFYERFRKKLSAHGSNKILLDRHRGDARALAPEEILELAPNIAALANSSQRVVFRPLLRSDILAFSGSRREIEQFCARGWTPALQQEDTIVFTGLAPDSPTRRELKSAAHAMGLTQRRNITIDIPANGKLGYALLRSLDTQLRNLGRVVTQLAQISIRNFVGFRTALQRVGQRAQEFPFMTQQKEVTNDRSIVNSIRQPDANNAADRSPVAVREPDQQPRRRVEPQIGRGSVVDRSDTSDTGLSREPERRDSHSRRASSRQQQVARGHRQDIQHDGDSAQKPDTASRRSGSASDPDRAEAISRRNVARARIIAHQYKLAVEYSPTRIVLFDRSKSAHVPLCEITSHKITPLKKLTSGLEERLQMSLGLPLAPCETDPTQDLIAAPDALVSDNSIDMFSADLTPPAPRPVKKKPRHLVIDFFDIDHDKLSIPDTSRITALADLDQLDLSELASITIEAKNVFDQNFARIDDVLHSSIQNGTIKPDVEIITNLAGTDLRHAYEEIVFLFEPSDANFVQYSSEKLRVIAVLDPHNPGAACDAIDPVNLQRIRLHREQPHADDIDDQITAFQKQLETTLSRHMTQYIEIETTAGPLAKVLFASLEYDDSPSI